MKDLVKSFPEKFRKQKYVIGYVSYLAKKKYNDWIYVTF